jgi:hypothetical protein
VNVKKHIAKTCFKTCFNPNYEEIEQPCLEKCFDHTLAGLSGVTRSLKEIGHMRNSRWINIVYGDNVDEFDRARLFCDKKPDMAGFPYDYFERNLYDRLPDS